MNVMIFGASGMVGQGVLRECLLDDRIDRVLSVGRSASGRTHGKLNDVVLADLTRLDRIADALRGYDACFFCLGVSSAGMSEERYTALTYDLTLAVARALVAINPAMRFIYITGAGTDSSEQGRSMWARVKGRTENALLALPFRSAHMLRPAIIQPMHGIRSKTALYRLAYVLMAPIMPLFKRTLPGYFTTTEQMGRAMIGLALNGSPKRILETIDINAIHD
jgi:uncharacterized protein YbjT (DUF2867 family)